MFAEQARRAFNWGDLAELYGIETKVLKRQVRRNIDRFPDDFMFELTREEEKNLRCQIGTSSWGGSRYTSMAFTEQGVAINAPLTQEFFATVQNKLHWAITGKTAAEIIYDSADAEKIHMGLTSWKQAPDGKILKSDVSIAKNYLSEAHIRELNRIVNAYLDPLTRLKLS